MGWGGWGGKYKPRGGVGRGGGGSSRHDPIANKWLFEAAFEILYVFVRFFLRF